jgi:biotin operon repressor
MNTSEIRALRRFFSALADEDRLRMLRLVSHDAYPLSDLAHVLNLDETTISDHAQVLRAVGVLNIKQDGTSYSYHLNTPMLNRMLVLSAELASAPEDEPDQDLSWIDQAELEDEDRDILRGICEGHHLSQIPTKQKKLMPVLRYLTQRFEPGRQYTEREVNDIIRQLHDDYVTLRRLLIDFHFLDRQSGGSLYWRTTP